MITQTANDVRETDPGRSAAADDPRPWWRLERWWGLATGFAIGLGDLAFVAILVLVVRPLAVFASTLGSKWNWRDRAFLMAMAPRGIVVFINCGSNQCTSPDDSSALARVIYDRIKQLLPVSLGGK